MADPLMEFIYIDGRDLLTSISAEDKKNIDPMTCIKIQPCLFQQDGIFATYQQSAFIENNRVGRYAPKLMKEHISFAHQWFKNIKWQQFSKAAKSLPVASQA